MAEALPLFSAAACSLGSDVVPFCDALPVDRARALIEYRIFDEDRLALMGTKVGSRNFVLHQNNNIRLPDTPV